MEFNANYAPVNERTARIAKEINSFSDYKEGSATQEQRYYVDCIVSYANGLLEKHPTDDQEKLDTVQSYIDRYSAKVAAAIDRMNSIDTRCPSVLVAGPSNFPVRKKEKQNAARDAFGRDCGYLFKTDSTNYFYKKIRLTLTESGAIMSDDKNAVDKIKAKIAKLETMPDPYGNKHAEIRRLKGRLLELSPDEMKAGKEITINGKPATFENIVSLFDGCKPRKSSYIGPYDDPAKPRYYIDFRLIFSDGKRKYREFVSIEVNEAGTEISTYGNAGNGYKPIWKPLDDYMKFDLIIGKIGGSGNKAVIYSILRDLDPRRQKAQEDATPAEKTATINGEPVTIKANAEAMRLQLFFDGKPAEETRSILKSNGFKWAPSQMAWQRLLNSNATSALNRIVSE